MTSGKLTVYFVATFLALVVACPVTSATDSNSSSAVNGTSNVTLTNKPAVSRVVPAVTSNTHVNASVAHLRIRRKGSAGKQIAKTVAGGVVSGATTSLIGGLVGGRV